MNIILKIFLLIILCFSSFEQLIAQEQIVQGDKNISELRVDQVLQLDITYDATSSAKTAGLGLRLHFDSDVVSLGELTSRLTEGVLPFQIKDDTMNLDNNTSTDKYFLTAWADTSGQGWPYESDLPVTLYSLPVTAKENFDDPILQFSAYTAVGYSLSANNIGIALAMKPVISLIGQSEISLELGKSYTDAGATASDNIDGDISGSIIISSDVDVNNVGTYSVTYNVSDTAGNLADEVTRVVNITPDVTKPIITLSGDAEVSLELGTAYNDSGAKASDNIDGDITSSIVTATNVDIYTVGTYSVTYNVSDAARNAADEVTRTVNITPDVTKPIITLSGDAEVSLEVGTAYNDSGATASDNIDGDITSSIVTANNVDISTVGTYLVTYNVSDAASNPADEVTRVVNITPDVTKPIITINGGDIDHEQGTSYTDLGATASDNIDGDITSSISVENNVDSDTAGTYTVVYSVSDSSGNAADQMTRTVIVSDNTKPIITLTEGDIDHEQGTPYTDIGATALDNIDGDITSSISVENNVDSDIAGTYTVVYSVSDSSGNAADQKTRTVVVSDTTKPIITLVGDSEINLLIDDVYVDNGAIAFDNIDGDITERIITINLVDTSQFGEYFITYNVKDSSDNEASEVVRLVSVGGTLDVDGNGQYDALSDGLLILRSMFGLQDDALIAGTIGSGATFEAAEEIQAQIDLLGALLDIDKNGSIDALTDGLLTLRYLFGLEGDTLINGVLAADATRTTAEEIEAHLEALMPSL